MIGEVKKVEAWRTSDGVVWETEALARQREGELSVQHVLENSPLYGDRDGATVLPEDLIAWIRANAELVLELVTTRE